MVLHHVLAQLYCSVHCRSEKVIMDLRSVLHTFFCLFGLTPKVIIRRITSLSLLSLHEVLNFSPFVCLSLPCELSTVLACFLCCFFYTVWSKWCAMVLRKSVYTIHNIHMWCQCVWVISSYMDGLFNYYNIYYTKVILNFLHLVCISSHQIHGSVQSMERRRKPWNDGNSGRLKKEMAFLWQLVVLYKVKEFW